MKCFYLIISPVIVNNMSQQSRTKRLPKILLGQFLVGLAIIVIAGYLVLYSLGYKLNLESRKIIKTGLVVLSVNPVPDSIQVAGKVYKGKDDLSVQLEPGYYEVTVHKEGYHDWQVRTEIKAEFVSYYKYVELFKENTELSTLTDQSKIEILDSPNSILASNMPKGLSSSDYEIWLDDKLITRFSEPISSATWLGDNHHIMYQQGSTIHIIDEDGSNNKILVNLPSSSPAKFNSSDRNRQINISQDGKYYYSKIQ